MSSSNFENREPSKRAAYWRASHHRINERHHPKIYQFADENMQINFAISLHAPNTELRSKLMPINRAYKLPELMEAVRYYIEKQGGA